MNDAGEPLGRDGTGRPTFGVREVSQLIFPERRRTTSCKASDPLLPHHPTLQQSLLTHPRSPLLTPPQGPPSCDRAALPSDTRRQLWTEQKAIVLVRRMNPGMGLGFRGSFVPLPVLASGSGRLRVPFDSIVSVKSRGSRGQ
jgi:hypothetical protein